MRIVGNDPTLSRQLMATASGAISAAGKSLIVNTDGTVTSTILDSATESLGSETIFETGEVGEAGEGTFATFDSSNNRVIIFYQDVNNSSYGTACVGSVSGTTITFGDPVVIQSANLLSFGATFDSSNNKVVVVYTNQSSSEISQASVGTVDPSDNSISFGTAATYDSSSGTSQNAATFDTNSNKVAIFYRDLYSGGGHGKSRVGTVSGTDITFGTEVTFESADTHHIECAFDSSNNKVVVAYHDGGNSYYGTAIVGTISGTDISFGSPVVFEAGTTTNVGIVFDSSNNKVIISYRDSSNSGHGTAIVGTVSGTSISFGSAAVFEAAGTEDIAITFDSNANKAVIAYYDDDDSDYGKYVIGTVSGTSISFGSATTFNAATTLYNSATFDSNENKAVIFFRDNGDSNKGKAVVLQNSFSNENLTTENFIGTSAHSAADGAKVLVNTQGAVDDNQSGLTAGQTYYVNKNGALVETTNITASAATAAVFESASTKVPDVCFDSTNNRIVIAYQDDDNSDYGTAIVGTVASDGSISFGTPVVFESATTGGSGIAIVHDSNSNKIVIAYEDEGNSQYGTAIVGTVDSADNSISFGSATVFESGEATTIDACFDSNSNKVVIAYSDAGNSQYGKAVVGTVSGTSISFGTIATFESAQTDYVSIAFDSTNNKAIIAYADGGDSGKGKAVVGTVSGTDISFGTVVTFENADTRWTSLAHDSSNEKTVIAYHDAGNSDYVTAIVGTVSGTDISFGTAVVAHSTANYGTSTTFNSDANKIVITYNDYTGTDLRIIDGTVSGTSISFASNVELVAGVGGFSSIGSVAGANHAVRNVFDSNVNKTVSVYRDMQNSNYGTAIVYTSGNDLSGSLATDAVTAGTALSATKLLVKG